MKVRVLQENDELFLLLYSCSKNKTVSGHIIFYYMYIIVALKGALETKQL
jgi:hypothetical protein